MLPSAPMVKEWVSRRFIFVVLVALFLYLVIDAAGVHLGAHLTLRLTSALMFIGLLIHYRQQSLPLPFFGLILSGLGLLIVQIVPLPGDLVKLLSPYRFELWQAAIHFLPNLPIRIALDPWLSLSTLLQGFAYILIFYVASWVFENEDHRYRFGKILVVVGTIFAAVGLAQRVLELEVRGYASFINRNQAAIFLLMILPFTLSGFLLSHGKKERLFFATCFLLQSLSALFSLSRFGIVGVGGAIVLSLIYYGWVARTHKLAGSWQSLLAAVGLILVALFYLFVVMGAADLKDQTERLAWPELFQGYRLDLWRDSVRAWLHSPLLGYGAGNFEQILPSFRTYIGYLRAEHAESEYLEVLVGCGAAGLSLLLLTLFLIGRRLCQLGVRRDWLHSGAVIVIMLLPIACTVHFIYEVPAIMVLVAMLMGMVMPLGEAKRVFDQKRGSRRLLIVGALTLLLAFMILSAHNYIKPAECTGRAETMSENLPAAKSAMMLSQLATSEMCIQTHPYDYRNYKQYALSLLYSGLRAESPQPYFEMALKLNPHDPAVHHGYARYLLKSNELTQAENHLKETLRLSQNVNIPGLKEVYRDLAKVQLAADKLETAELSLQNYTALGGADAERMRLQAELHNAQLKMPPKELRAFINRALITSKELETILPIITESSPIDYLYLPAPPAAGDGLKLEHLGQKVESKISQLSRFDDTLNDWLYILEAKYPPSREYLDLWGTPAAIYLSPAILAQGVTLELLLKSKNPPKRQLQATFVSSLGEETLTNKTVVPEPGGWYRLQIDLKELLKTNATVGRTLTSVAFNTGMIAGIYQLSSFRIYFVKR